MADLGDFVQHFVNGSGRLPNRSEAIAFAASVAASAALLASRKPRYETSLLPKLVGAALFAMTATFASVMFDLRECQTQGVEDFYCYWTFGATLWILSAFAGILGIHPWKWGDRIPDPEPYVPQEPMPALFPAFFLSHGSPMLALAKPEEDPYVRTLAELGATLPKPKALVFVSAHWYVPGKFADVSEWPKTVYDFYGFPSKLSSVSYPASGYPEILADLDAVFGSGYWTGKARGLDHGVWTTLVHLRPESDIPVTTLSVDSRATPDEIFELGRKLRELRKMGYLVIGSGNVVHDLASVDFARGPGSEPHAFAKIFDEAFKDAVERGDFDALADPYGLPGGVRSVPTPEHYLPALAVLGTVGEDEEVSWIFEGFEMGSV